MSGKWTVVPGKKGNSGAKETVSKKLGGLQESTSTFSQFSRQTASDDEEVPEDVAPSSSKTSKQRVAPPTGVPAKKKTVVKKPKVVKYDFDEFVREINPKTIKGLTKEARQKYPTHSQNLLMEVTRQIQEQFGEVEVEREFAFTNRTPGYPLTALSGPCQDPLLSVINSSPILAQESIFRHCLDTLLAEVRAGQPSYGTRIILQLLINCKPSTCIECTQKVKLLLQSSLSKVPEALSLLWAGLPHPQLHLDAALEVWPELCLPLLYSTPNVPRQVLNYTVDYTCNLLRMVGEREADLFSKLPPTTLCALLASPQLSTRKAQTNVQEMLQLLQTTLVNTSSDKQISQYFTAVFKRLAEEKSPAAVSFAMCCLSHSLSSVRSWQRTFPSLPLPSQLLLKELASQEKLSTDLPLYELSVTLSQIVARGSPEEKTLAQCLLTRHKALFIASQQRQSATGGVEVINMTGGWCSGCGFLLMLLSIVYLVLLSLFLVQLARNGPGELVVMIEEYIPVKKEWLDYVVTVLWQVLSACVQFWNEITNRLF